MWLTPGRCPFFFEKVIQAVGQQNVLAYDLHRLLDDSIRQSDNVFYPGGSFTVKW